MIFKACGSGGRELVFQTGPGHPWLVAAYAEVCVCVLCIIVCVCGPFQTCPGHPWLVAA